MTTAHPPTQAPEAADIPQVLADVAEKSTDQARESVERMGAAAGAATDQIKNVYATSFKGAQDYGTKVLEFAHANMNASFEHARRLAGAKSPAEFFALSNEYLRLQVETLSRQAQELAAIAQQMTSVATGSAKAELHGS